VTAAAELPPIIASRYRAVRLIAKGGMGAVYEVEHVRTGERLALKVLLSGAGASAGDLDRFKREARVSARIESEHVARVTDAGTAPEIGGAFFFVMELLDGMNLEEAATLSLPAPAIVVDWMSQAAHAIDEAHRLGIVHRDLKPENLFLATVKGAAVKGGRRSIVKVLDFGIAKMIEEGSGGTGTGQLLGTPRYMAPEQATGNFPVTPATDLCALGLVAYRLLTGESYYQGGAMVILGQLLGGDLPLPSERGSRLGRAFDAWFSKACHRDPRERYASAREQIEALSAAVGEPGEPAAPTNPVVPSSLSSSSSSSIAGAIASKPSPPTRVTAGRRAPILIASVLAAAGLVTVLAVRAAHDRGGEAAPSSARQNNTGVWGTARDDVWVGGSLRSASASRTGVLSHWDGRTWSHPAGETYPPIWSVWGSGPRDLWAVTDRGGIWHRSATGWTASRTPTDWNGALMGIWGSGAGDIWAVGDRGIVVHGDGASWSEIDSGAGPRTLVGVWGSGPRDVWIVGSGGLIRHWDGRAWAGTPSGAAADLFDIWGSGPSDIWATGASGTLVHWNGAEWSPRRVDTKGDLMGVWGSGRDDVWAVGFGGTALHWDGVRWIGVASGTTQTLYEVWGTGVDDVWAVGENGTVLRWNGRTWSCR